MKIFNVALLALAAAPALVQATGGPEHDTFGFLDCVPQEPWDTESTNPPPFNYVWSGLDPVISTLPEKDWFRWEYEGCGLEGKIDPTPSWAGPFTVHDDVHIPFQNPADYITDDGVYFCVILKLYFGANEGSYFEEQLVASKKCITHVSVTDFGTAWATTSVSEEVFEIETIYENEEDNSQGQDKLADLVISYANAADGNGVWYGQDWVLCIKDYRGSSIELIDGLYFDVEPIIESPVINPGQDYDGDISTLPALTYTEYQQRIGKEHLYCPANPTNVNKQNPEEYCCTVPGDKLNLVFYKAKTVYIKASASYDFSPDRRLGASHSRRVLQVGAEKGTASAETDIKLNGADDASGANQAGLFMAGAVGVLGMLAL